MSARGAVVVAMAVVLAACGGGGATFDDRASSELGLRVAAVREAVTAQDRPRAEQLLAELDAAVERLTAEGAVDPTRADEVRAAADGVRAQLPAITTTTTTTSPSQPPDDHEQEEREEEKEAREEEKDDD